MLCEENTRRHDQDALISSAVLLAFTALLCHRVALAREAGRALRSSRRSHATAVQAGRGGVQAQALPAQLRQGPVHYFAMTRRPDLEVLNYYQQTCLTARPWNGGQWPDRIDEVVRGKETLQEAFRKDLGREWYWTVANTPAVGATAHYGESCGAGFGATGHVAYVAGFDAGNLSLLHDNFPTGSLLDTRAMVAKPARRDASATSSPRDTQPGARIAATDNFHRVQDHVARSPAECGLAVRL